MKPPVVPILIALSLAIASPALSFDPTVQAARRITVLQSPIHGATHHEERVAARVRRVLIRALQERGFDAAESDMSFRELRRSGDRASDVYVEIAPSDSYATSPGGAEVRMGRASIDIDVVVSHVAAELRIYDGRTLELRTKRALRHEDVSIVPTAAGADVFPASVWLALDVFEHVRSRAAVNAVVREAMDEIDSLTR